jgi:hypothetical protein
MEHIEALPGLKESDTTGLRLDIAIEDTTTGEVCWVDATAVHTTSPSYLAEEVKATVSRQLSAAFATDYKLPDLLQEEPSPILANGKAKRGSSKECALASCDVS